MTGLDRSTGANRQLLDDIQGVSRPDTDVVGLNNHDPYLADDRDDAQERSFALQTAGVIQGRDSSRATSTITIGSRWRSRRDRSDR